MDITDEEKNYSSDYHNNVLTPRPDFPLGGVVLDVAERDLAGIVTRVVDHMIASGHVPPDHRDDVIGILLRKHISSLTTDNSEEKASSKGRKSSSEHELEVPNKFPLTTSDDDIHSVVSSGYIHKLKKFMKSYIHHNLSIEIEVNINVLFNNEDSVMKTTIDGQELTAVMAGGVSFLQTPILTFVRLSEGVLLGDLTKVSMPLRFIFVLLGPFHDEKDYYEIGLSISTLMASKVFREAAYTAHSWSQLLATANEVLPPVTWTSILDEVLASHTVKRECILLNSVQCTQETGFHNTWQHRINTDPVASSQTPASSNKDAKTDSITANYMQIRLATCNSPKAIASAAAGGGNDGDKKPPPRDPLIRVGKPFYGLYLDIKDRYPKYPSDIIDGLNVQVLAATIFIFFVVLSTAITFGGIYSSQTNNYIGVGECLLLSCVNGVIFALFAAQPLLAVGPTGPLMVFDMSLYKFAQMNELDFLSMRIWIGFWMTIIGIVFVAFEGVVLVRKITRFTEEIFALMTSLIFIYEACTQMVGFFKDHPLLSAYDYQENVLSTCFRPKEDLNDTEVGLNTTGGDLLTLSGVPPQPNTALLSLILMMGTFIIAIKLKKFRNSKYLGRSVRRGLGDFGIPIAIFLMVLLDYINKETYTDKLTMPEGIQPSSPDIRGWFINPFGQVKPLPVWCMFAAAPAAILVFFLVFLEENICHLILSKPERKIVKGTGFHLDLVLSCFINLMSGLLGAPFMGPACIRTVAHAAALTVTSPARAPGQPLKVEGVREQRLSSLVVAILVGLSVLLSDALNLVPKSVLFGVFLYMGIASTAGIHFLERTVLMFMPVKYHPDTPYVNKVRTVKMHIFTTVQLILLGVLLVVLESPAALVLPFVLSLLVPLRLYLLPIIFTKSELSALDGTDANATDDSEEPDFYEAPHAIPIQAVHITRAEA